MARTKRQLTQRERVMAARFAEVVARNVRRLRAGRFSQEELAFRAGLDRTLISGIERGRHNATLFTLLALADTLQVEPQRLLDPSGLYQVPLIRTDGPSLATRST